MFNDQIAELDRRLSKSWFDGVLAAVAAGALTAGLRCLIELLSMA